jgi:hypothetical protein
MKRQYAEFDIDYIFLTLRKKGELILFTGKFAYP